MKYTHGLVFRSHGKLFLAKYDEEGIIQDADDISDPESIYDELPLNTIAVVAVEDEETGRFNLRDLFTISVTHEENHPDALERMLSEGLFPGLANDIWEKHI